MTASDMHHPENDPSYLGLTVNKGVAQPPSINPYLNLRRKRQRKEYSVQEFVEGILSGNIALLSQAVTLVESSLPEHQEMAQAIIEQALPYSGNSIRVGITGVPGAGKSTSIDAFGMHLIGRDINWPFWQLTRRVNGPRVASSVTRPGWRSCRLRRMHLSDLHPRQARWGV